MDVTVLKEADGAQDGQFSVIHIPLDLYAPLLQPILQVLLPSRKSDQARTGRSVLAPEDKHQFLNISVTPVECSIVCLASWAQRIFGPGIASLPASDAARVHISRTVYNIFSVNSTGTEAGQRVLDLTAPLALAGIPIFYITTFYADFILVRAGDRHNVGAALLARGFEYSAQDSVYVSPAVSSTGRRSSGSTAATASPTGTASSPIATNIDELYQLTFRHLRTSKVEPFIVPHLQVVQVSGREPHEYPDGFAGPSIGSARSGSWLSRIDPTLYLGLVGALTEQPRFLSVTLGLDDAPSILLDRDLLCYFEDAITGEIGPPLVPVFLDLIKLPLECTGIVSGVAGKLHQDLRASQAQTTAGPDDALELSYLSTARAGAVMLPSASADQAVRMLCDILQNPEAPDGQIPEESGDTTSVTNRLKRIGLGIDG